MVDHDDILRRGFEEYRDLVNPVIAERARLAGEPVHIVHVRDGIPIDGEGRPIVDLHGLSAFGQRHPAVTAALMDYLRSDRPSWFPSRVNPYAGRLARVLSERTGYDNAFFPCTGTEAVEAALKLARALTRRPGLLSLEGAYHGCTFGSCALMTPGVFKDAFAPHLPGARVLPFDDVDTLREALAAGDVAAVVVEPIQGEGGVRPLSDAYIAALCELTEQHGTLLVADEMQTGLGRTGRGILHSAQWPRRPDVVLLGKALGGGLVPISAMLTRRELFMRAYGTHFASGESHNTTFMGHAIGCVAALATLEILTDELIATCRRRGAFFEERLEAGLTGNRLFSHVRGEGLMRGVALADLDHPWLSFDHFGYPDLEDHCLTGPLVCHRLYGRGFFAFPCGHDWSVLRLQPRLDVDEDTLAGFVTALSEELAHLAALA